MSTKVCSGCGKEKPLEQFSRDANGKEGRRSTCKECCSAYGKSHYRANLDKAKSQHKEWASKNRQRSNARVNNWRAKLRSEVVAAYGGKCSCCGESHVEFLAIDHIHGGGRRHRQSTKTSTGTFYLWLKRGGFPKEDFRLLCHNCNMAIGIYGYCPHQKEDSECGYTSQG